MSIGNQKVSMFNFQYFSDHVLVTVVTNTVTDMSTVYTNWSFTDDVNIQYLSLGHESAIKHIKKELGVI